MCKIHTSLLFAIIWPQSGTTPTFQKARKYMIRFGQYFPAFQPQTPTKTLELRQPRASLQMKETNVPKHLNVRSKAIRLQIYVKVCFFNWHPSHMVTWGWGFATGCMPCPCIPSSLRFSVSCPLSLPAFNRLLAVYRAGSKVIPCPKPPAPEDVEPCITTRYLELLKKHAADRKWSHEGRVEVGL